MLKNLYKQQLDDMMAQKNEQKRIEKERKEEKEKREEREEREEGEEEGEGGEEDHTPKETSCNRSHLIPKQEECYQYLLFIMRKEISGRP